MLVLLLCSLDDGETPGFVEDFYDLLGVLESKFC